MNYSVISKREVPVSSSHAGFVKTFVVNNNYGGSKGVYVKLENGCSAWGFGSEWSLAESNAVAAAMEI